MSLASAESLVEQRVAQLEVISTRRNELLRQMYHMMRRRNNVGLVLAVEEPEEGDIQSFLQRFDIAKDPDTGSITNLDMNGLLLEGQSQASALTFSPSVIHEKNDLRRATRSQSRVENLTKSPSPSLSRQIVVSTINLRSPVAQETVEVLSTKMRLRKSMDVDDDRDELDLIGSPPSHGEVGRELIDVGEDDRPLPQEDSSGIGGVERSGDSMVIDNVTGEESISPVTTITPAGPVVLGVSPSSITEEPVNTKNEDTDVLMNVPEGEAEDGSEEEVSRTVDVPPSLPAIQSPAPNEPVKSSIPFTHLGPSSPIQVSQTPRPSIIILAPSSPLMDTTAFTFGKNAFAGSEQSQSVDPPTQQHQYRPNYPLPSLKSLPPEFNRKVKAKSRRKEKDTLKEKENGKKEDWFPMGVNRWAATLNANPVWKRVSRPLKCLTSREWAVAMTELKLIRTLDRIESLKDGGRWGFRQPKKQRGVGGLVKTHWDYLIDEMKWMRIDFREERRWKIALAYTLATAVVEWHAAGSLEERVKQGICALWSPAYLKPEDIQEDAVHNGGQARSEVPTPQSELTDRAARALLGVDYGSDEEEDQQDVVDALQPRTMVQDALEVPLLGEGSTNQEMPIKPKTEETDNVSALQFTSDAMQTDIQPINNTLDQPTVEVGEKDTKEGINGLKPTSSDPVMGGKASSNSSSNNGDGDTPTTSAKSLVKQTYASLRGRILESDLNKLFLDLDDFHITQTGEHSNPNYDPIEVSLPPADLSTIFPELQPLGVLDIAPAVAPTSEGKKKAEKRSDRDDPNKRIEDTTYNKLFPIGQFMHTKPTLIGSLQPSKNWKDGKWLPLVDPPVYVEYEGPIRPPEDAMSEIFDNRLSNSTILAQQQLMFAAARDREKGKRTTEHQWSTSDDTLLKSLIDRYPYNWQLISESFNAIRVVAPTDKRTARDCFERWREKWAPEVRRHPEPQPQPTPTVLPAAEEGTMPTSQMTTRGVKRLASGMAVTPAPNASGSSEPKKRRRHILLQETIRRSVKKKAEFQQKMLGNQRKPSTIHETHGPFNSMRYYSPSELSRMKAEKDAKATQEVQLRRRQEEVTRAAMQARLTPAQQQSLVQHQLQQQLQQQAAQQQNQSQPLGTPAQQQPQIQPQQSQQAGQQTPQPAPAQTQQATTTQTGAQPQQVSQQAQVANIAQRSQNVLLANPAFGASRLTPQQLLQLQQAQQVRPGSQPVQVAAHQLTQQGQILVPSLNGNGTVLNGAHLAPFVNRDSTSSPAHVSPPRKSATPTNVSSPRITTDQVQQGQVQIGMVPTGPVGGNPTARPTSNMNYYNIPGLTQEQISVLRMQIMQQQQQQSAQDGSGQAPAPNSFS